MAGLIVFRQEGAAQRRLDLQEGKQICAAGDDRDEIGESGQVHAADAFGVPADVLEGVTLRAPILHVRQRGDVSQRTAQIFGAGLGHLDDLIGLGKRQRPQQHGVDDREHRGIHADAKRQRQNRDGREAGILAQLAKCVAKILEESGHKRSN